MYKHTHLLFKITSKTDTSLVLHGKDHKGVIIHEKKTYLFPKNDYMLTWFPELIIGFWKAGLAVVNFSHFPMHARQQPESEIIEHNVLVILWSWTNMDPCLLNRNVGSSLSLKQHLPSGANHVLNTVLLRQHQDRMTIANGLSQARFILH